LPLVPSAAGFDIIAEHKLRSPAAGTLPSKQEDIAARVASYAAAGAVAVSVLTEPSEFHGELSHLELAARALRASETPALRKDFVVDAYQVAQARAAGASGVLVILRMLAPSQLQAVMAAAERFGLFMLLEAFDEDDIKLAHELVAGLKESPNPTVLVGVNCRSCPRAFKASRRCCRAACRAWRRAASQHPRRRGAYALPVTTWRSSAAH
jgi:indole-3-glycerol phosphate synthase